MLGVPVPDATPWDQIEVVGDRAYKVCAKPRHDLRYASASLS
jgi:hypothetical protein